jgi:hypothetical protein
MLVSVHATAFAPPSIFESKTLRFIIVNSIPPIVNETVTLPNIQIAPLLVAFQAERNAANVMRLHNGGCGMRSIDVPVAIILIPISIERRVRLYHSLFKAELNLLPAEL